MPFRGHLAVHGDDHAEPILFMRPGAGGAATGAGKTELAKQVARILGIGLYQISPSLQWISQVH